MLTQEFQDELRAHANPHLAVPMAAYLKNQFTLLGIKSGPRKELYPSYFSEWKKLSSEEHKLIALELWQQPEREFQYAAVDWMRRIKLYSQPESILLFEQMVTENSWWDTVDSLAVNLVGPYFLKYPEKRDDFIEKWDKSPNMWLNRTAILFQLKYKLKTDTDLLFYLIESHVQSQEFFIRKAIGWALRELAKTHRALVEDFIEKTPLSGLSRREALKHIG